MGRKIIALLCATALLCACTPQEDSTIHVGAIGPFSGEYAFFGEWAQQGFDFAREDLQTKYGLNITITYENDGCEAATAITALNKLRHVDGLTLAVGVPCGSGTKAGAPWADENGMLMVSAGDNFGHASDNWYSTRFVLHQEMDVLADFAYKHGSRRVGIIYFQNEWGEVSQHDFTEKFTALGGTVVGAESYPIETDFRTTLLKFKEAHVDSVVMIYNNVGDIVNQLAELEMNVTKFADSQVETEQSVTVGGKNLVGVLYARPVGSDAPSTQAFIKKYQARYGREPDTVTIDSYDALLVLGTGLAHCKNQDIDCVRTQVQSTHDLPGANGLLTFDPTFWGFEKHFIIKTFKDGSFQTYHAN